MPTPAERQALIFVAAVAALGVAVRAWRSVDRPAPDPAARTALAQQLARVDSAITVGGGRRPRVRARADGGAVTGRGSADATEPDEPRAPAPRRRRVESRTPASATPDVPPTPVDVDVATVEELDRLPGIGPALAARIVEDRDRLGPFGSVDALDRVRGIGSALTERLRPHVTFSGSPRPPDTEVPQARRARRP